MNCTTLTLMRSLPDQLNLLCNVIVTLWMFSVSTYTSEKLNGVLIVNLLQDAAYKKGIKYVFMLILLLLLIKWQVSELQMEEDVGFSP